MQAPAIQLLSTDFDGTLLSVERAPHVAHELEDAIAFLRESGAKWVINTGRSLDLTIQGLEEGHFRFTPDFIIASERELYFRDRAEWKPFGEWNKSCQKDLTALFHVAAPLLKEIGTFVRSSGKGSVLMEGGLIAGLLATSEEAMSDLCIRIDEMRRSCPLLSYQRNSIYLRFSHLAYDKGSTLCELRRLLDISSEATFAVGDQFNDLPMLRPEVAGYLACPANAITEVKRAVANAGGFLADEPFGYGVLAAIRFFNPSVGGEEFAA